MIKKLIVLFASFTLILILGAYSVVQAATPVLDQYFEGTENLTPQLGGTYNNGQTFQPSLTRLSYVSVRLGCTGAGTAYLHVKQGTSGITLATASQALTPYAGYRWTTFNFAEQAVTVGEEYSIWMSGGGTITWAHGDAGGSSYANGVSYVLGVQDASADFHFRTYGYTPSTPSNQNTNHNANQNTNSSTAERLIPRNLKSTEVGDTWLQLSWDEPLDTTNVKGYLLEWGERCDQIKESADVGDNTSYRLNNLQQNKDYCLVVSSYDKDYKASERSNELQIKTLSQESQSQTKDKKGQWWLVGIFSAIALIILGVIIYLIVRAKKIKKMQGDKEDKKRHDGPKGAGPDAPIPTPTDNPQLEKPKSE